MLGASAAEFSVTNAVTETGGTVELDGSSATSMDIDLSGLSAENHFNVTGSAGADCVVGSSYAETLDGGLSNDTLIAGGGADWLDGGAGADELYGGAGDDTFFFSSLDVTSGESIDAGDDVDEIQTEAGGTVDLTGAAISFVETIHVGAGGTAIFDESNSLGATWTLKGNADTVSGSHETFRIDVDSATGQSISSAGLTFDFTWVAGQDHIELDGNAGDDTLTGGSRGETLTGGGGADVLDGGAGGNLLDGGAGQRHHHQLGRGHRARRAGRRHDHGRVLHHVRERRGWHRPHRLRGVARPFLHDLHRRGQAPVRHGHNDHPGCRSA